MRLRHGDAAVTQALYGTLAYDGFWMGFCDFNKIGDAFIIWGVFEGINRSFPDK